MAVMPQGVEHPMVDAASAGLKVVAMAVMPQGVEHYTPKIALEPAAA